MKNKISTLLLCLLFLIGLSLLLYPTVSDYWNSLHQSRAITHYAEKVADLDDETYQKLWDEATEYNDSLLGRTNSYILNEEQQARYGELLNVDENGIMGHIEIPSLNVSLPIYHGTAESVLQIAVGHLEWTSLPVGGESTHCVLSGHRGLPSAKLFTDLDKLVVGDRFILQILDETLTYEVDQILIVEPQETEALQIVEGQDYCTLVTCTPYGVNSHRLLVRGHRVENEEEVKTVRVTADAIQIEPLIVAPLVGVPMLFILLMVILANDSRKSKRRHSTADKMKQI